MILDENMKLNIALGLALVILILVIVLIFRKSSTKQGYAYVANNKSWNPRESNVQEYSNNGPWQALWDRVGKSEDPERDAPLILDPQYNACRPRSMEEPYYVQPYDNYVLPEGKSPTNINDIYDHSKLSKDMQDKLDAAAKAYKEALERA
jgi:hypothetical protein